MGLFAREDATLSWYSVQWILLVLIPVVSIILLKKPKNWKILGKLPGPSIIPIIGNGWELNVGNHEIITVVTKWWKAHGNRMVFAIGYQPVVLLSDPSDVEKVLTSQVHIDKSQDYTFFNDWLGLGLLTATGQRWFNHRKLLTPSFHFKILDNFIEVFNEKASILVKLMNERYADRQQQFQMFPYVSRCTLDIIGEAAMGTTLNAQFEEGQYLNSLKRLLELYIIRITRPWCRSAMLWSISSYRREEKKCIKVLHNFTDKVIQDRKTIFRQTRSRILNELSNNKQDEDIFGKKKQRLAFLDLLLETQAQNEYFTDLDIRQEVDTFLFAGHDTTTSNISFCIFTIGSHPEVQRKVQEELDSILGEDRNKYITSEDLSKMKYLECCIKETLRLYPSVALFARDLNQPLELDSKLKIPNGTIIYVAPYFVHRDENIYPDAEKFNPERFLGENTTGRHPYAFIPFSAGPRNCIGQKFAMLEIKVVLASLFRHFNIKTMENPENLELTFDIILKPRCGVPIQISRRN